LAIALLVVYIESKSREQNHKIGSMLSLVSSLAEELNSIKFQRGGGVGRTNDEQNSLVTVSDGDDETLGDDDDIEDDDDEDDDEDEDGDEDEDEDGDEDGDQGTGDCNDDKSVIEVDNLLGADISKTNNIKILKLTLNAGEYESVTSDKELEDLEDLEDLDEAEDLDESEDLEEEQNVSLFDLKSINISNLEEKEDDSIELRKQPVNKLRSIVVEKGLAADPSKLKKQELLKLLGAE